MGPFPVTSSVRSWAIRGISERESKRTICKQIDLKFQLPLDFCFCFFCLFLLNFGVEFSLVMLLSWVVWYTTCAPTKPGAAYKTEKHTELIINSNQPCLLNSIEGLSKTVVRSTSRRVVICSRT